MHTIHVKLPQDEYPIMIEAGLLPRLGEIVDAVAAHERALVVVDRNVEDTYGQATVESLEAAGYAVVMHAIEATESHKSIDTVTTILDALLAHGMERRSPVVAVGGGLTGDVAGFAAASYLRGVPVVQVPTTLLAMVDASVGGKTGVNYRMPSGEIGKNLVGAFWQPRAVVVDPDTLASLEDRDYRCGLAECVKHGLIADVSLLTFLAEHLDEIDQRDGDLLADLVRRAVKIKVAVVQQDERESGIRAILNLGHTFAHAIEPISELDLRHGEAVSIGLCAAAHAAVATDRLDAAEGQSINELLDMVSLPTALRAPVAVDRLVAAMSFDKKVQDGVIRLVLPVGLGQVDIVDDVPEHVIRDAWLHVGAGSA